jgi:hypothetical protein
MFNVLALLYKIFPNIKKEKDFISPWISPIPTPPVFNTSPSVTSYEYSRPQGLAPRHLLKLSLIYNAKHELDPGQMLPAFGGRGLQCL